MSLSSTAPGADFAANALRSAGLIDRDAQMRDVSQNPGGKKTTKTRSTRLRMDVVRNERTPPTRMHSARMAGIAQAGPSDPRAAAIARLPGAARARKAGPSSIPVPTSSVPHVRFTKQPVEAWREVVRSRYDADKMFLNLESLADDELVKKYRLDPPGSGGTGRDAAVIFKLASQLKPEVQTLSLANNGLNGSFLVQLHRYLPNLVNLSLRNNKIRDKKEITNIVPRRDKMIKLRELELLGNPIREIAYSNGAGETYRRELVRRFTSLAVLDQEPITQISFDAPTTSAPSEPVEKPSSTTFPCPMGPPFVTGVNGDLISKFLSRFLGLYDNQRDQLVHVYAPGATFSFSANTSIPARARIEGFHSSHKMPNQRKLEWGPWLEAGSRNLSRIGSDPVKTVSNLHIGGERIVAAMASLPKTQHDISGPAEKFCLDTFPIAHGQSMGLMLMVHGQFTEAANGGIRSFDRTFMLAPAPEGSAARFNGWDVVILSDQLTIRGYSSHEAWKPGPLLVQAQPKGAAAPGFSMASLPPDQQAALATLPEQQRNLVLEVCGRTNLNVKFAADCLVNNGWDLERATANFNSVKGSLGREAYL